jgi:hypothetical protein
VDRFGFIHEKLDIKILILFVLRRLPEAVDAETLADLVLCDDGISYFDYVECLAELEQTGHLTVEGHRYKITEKGDRNGGAIESSLPYSVRKKAEKLLTPVAGKMRRNALIKTEHTVSRDGACMLELGLSDGCGEILEVRMLVPGEERARQMEQRFRARAEEMYDSFVQLLSEE